MGEIFLNKLGKKNIEPVVEDKYLYFPKEKGNLELHGTLRLKY